MNEKQIMCTMKGVKDFLDNIYIRKLETYSKITNFLKSNQLLFYYFLHIVLFYIHNLFYLNNYSPLFTRNGKTIFSLIQF